MESTTIITIAVIASALLIALVLHYLAKSSEKARMEQENRERESLERVRRHGHRPNFNQPVGQRGGVVADDLGDLAEDLVTAAIVMDVLADDPGPADYTPEPEPRRDYGAEADSIAERNYPSSDSSYDSSSYDSGGGGDCGGCD